MQPGELAAFVAGAALGAGGALVTYLGFVGESAAKALYVGTCLFPGSGCAALRAQIATLEMVMVVGLVVAFVGADLLVLWALRRVFPRFLRILAPAP